MTTKTAEAAGPLLKSPRRRRVPPELSIFLVLIGIALVYEILGWIFVGRVSCSIRSA